MPVVPADLRKTFDDSFPRVCPPLALGISYVLSPLRFFPRFYTISCHHATFGAEKLLASDDAEGGPIL
jgi:hypothetical protein